MKTKLLRSMAVLAIAFVGPAVPGAPASATTFPSSTISANVFAIGQNGTTETIPLGGTGGTGCGSSLTVDQTGSDLDVTALTATRRYSFSTTPTPYVVIFTRLGSAAGTLTTTGTGIHVIASLFVTVRLDVFVALNSTSTATDCSTTGTRVCRLAMTLHFGGTATADPLTSSSTASVGTPPTTISVTPPCGVPFTTFNTGTASAAGTIQVG